MKGRTLKLEIPALVEAMAVDLEGLMRETRRAPAAMIGIRRGGVWVAQRLHRRLALDEPLGELNIAYYRDDFSQIGMHPSVEPSHLPFTVDGRHVVLVDDVLFTGRTVRAALNEIFDYGRPASVSLAVLVDRGGRELPIQADVVGARLALGAGEHVKLSGPDPLALAVHKAA